MLKAVRKTDKKVVAIKQFRQNDLATLRIAEREIKMLRIVKGHPNIIGLLNVFLHNSKLFLVFERMQKNLL